MRAFFLWAAVVVALVCASVGGAGVAPQSLQPAVSRDTALGAAAAGFVAGSCVPMVGGVAAATAAAAVTSRDDEVGSAARAVGKAAAVAANAARH